MLKLSCLCGQVRIEMPTRPDCINECFVASRAPAGPISIRRTSSSWERRRDIAVKTRKTRLQKSVSVQIVVQRHILFWPQAPYQSSGTAR